MPELTYVQMPEVASVLEVPAPRRHAPYYIYVTEPGSHLLLILGVAEWKPGHDFIHPNMIRSLATTFYYKRNGRWAGQSPGREFLLAIPRKEIEIGLDPQGYSYVTLRINGQTIVLNTSGGTSPNCDGWIDYIHGVSHACINYPPAVMRQVAEVAERGTRFEEWQTDKEKRAQFYEEHPDDWISVAAEGSWSHWVPDGMVGLTCVEGAERAQSNMDRGPRRYFLVPAEEYNATPFAIDPEIHEEVSRDRVRQGEPAR